MAAVCAVLGAYTYLRQGATSAVAFWLLVSAALAAAAAWQPTWLRPLARAWMALGTMLGRIISPLVLAVIFYLVITPVALVGRLFGRDELRLRRSKQVDSYWIERDPKGPDANSFRNQY
jgi:Saxitoxin biosynthesis operon protein SxtJ